MKRTIKTQQKQNEVINKSRTNRQQEMETKLNNKHLALSVIFYLVSVPAFGNKLFQNEETK